MFEVGHGRHYQCYHDQHHHQHHDQHHHHNHPHPNLGLIGVGHVRGGGHGPGISIPRAHELPKAQSLSLIFPLITLITSFHFSFHHFLVETNVVRVDIFTIMAINDIIK